MLSSSAGYQVLALFLNLFCGAPPRAELDEENTQVGNGRGLRAGSTLEVDGVSSDVSGQFVGESCSWGGFVILGLSHS